MAPWPFSNRSADTHSHVDPGSSLVSRKKQEVATLPIDRYDHKSISDVVCGIPMSKLSSYLADLDSVSQITNREVLEAIKNEIINFSLQSKQEHVYKFVKEVEKDQHFGLFICQKSAESMSIGFATLKASIKFHPRTDKERQEMMRHHDKIYIYHKEMVLGAASSLGLVGETALKEGPWIGERERPKPTLTGPASSDENKYQYTTQMNASGEGAIGCRQPDNSYVDGHDNDGEGEQLSYGGHSQQGQDYRVGAGEQQGYGGHSQQGQTYGVREGEQQGYGGHKQQGQYYRVGAGEKQGYGGHKQQGQTCRFGEGEQHEHGVRKQQGQDYRDGVGSSVHAKVGWTEGRGARSQSRSPLRVQDRSKPCNRLERPAAAIRRDNLDGPESRFVGAPAHGEQCPYGSQPMADMDVE